MYSLARSLRRVTFVLIFTLAATFTVRPANASSVLFSTNGPQTVGGRQVNAQARFDIDNADQKITVTVLDMLTNPTDVAQLVSSVQFTISNGSLSNQLPTIQSSDGTTQINISSDAPSVAVAPPAVGWVIQQVSAVSFSLCDICTSGKGSAAPAQLLIGDPASNGLYTNANGSIDGNNPHNPFILASGSGSVLAGLSGYSGSSPRWVLTLPQLTPTSTVQSVTFGFGTTWGLNLTLDSGTNLGDVPEPASWALLGIGLFLLCVRRLRIHRLRLPGR